MLLREKLGIDKPLVVAANKEYLDKREKEAVNLVARASGEGRAIVRPNQGNSTEPYTVDLRDDVCRIIMAILINFIATHCKIILKARSDF